MGILDHLINSNAGYAEIMDRLNTTPDTLKASIHRAGRPDLLARLAQINKPTRSAA